MQYLLLLHSTLQLQHGVTAFFGNLQNLSLQLYEMFHEEEFDHTVYSQECCQAICDSWFAGVCDYLVLHAVALFTLQATLLALMPCQVRPLTYTHICFVIAYTDNVWTWASKARPT